MFKLSNSIINVPGFQIEESWDFPYLLPGIAVDVGENKEYILSETEKNI